VIVLSKPEHTMVPFVYLSGPKLSPSVRETVNDDYGEVVGQAIDVALVTKLQCCNICIAAVTVSCSCER